MWSVDDWQPADFAQRPVPNRPSPVDPWQVVPLGDAHHDSQGRVGDDAELDIWLAELRTPETPRQVPNIPLPVLPSLVGVLGSIEFDPQARQHPWRPEPSASGRESSKARRKAASMVTLLEISHARDREAALSLLAELFEEFPHSATYRALLDQVATGVDLETLRAMAELKRLWLATPEWWSRRHYCPLRRQFVLTRDRAGNAALSWGLARRICEAQWLWPDWAMIRDEWLSEWLTLPFTLHRCRSFAQFIDWRLDCAADSEVDPIHAEPMEDWLQPVPHRWHEVAASAGTLSDLIATNPAPQPDRLQ